MQVIKADGSREAFNESKLLSSLTRSGAGRELAGRVVREVERRLSDGMRTSDIYRNAFRLLREAERPAAARYSMRRAILAFGPTGFPFEDFVAEIFKALGYKTETRRVLRGVCVLHEVDLIARKEGKCIGAEVKFHNRIGVKSDLKVALYVRARFEDIIERMKEGGNTCELDEGWLITNTKFSSEAITYGKCAHLTMVGWAYPKERNLQDLIEETKVHPLTALTTLSQKEKIELLRNKVVLCKALQDKQDIMHKVGIKMSKIDSALRESALLCQP
jgi:hypothetical protein